MVDSPAKPTAASSSDHDAAAYESRGGLSRLAWLLPLGLAIDILLSLWVSYRHVTHSVIVQVEPVWIPGEQLAVRSQLIDHDRDGVENTRVQLSFTDAKGGTVELGELKAIKGGGLNQGSISVPAAAALGEGTFTVRFTAQPKRGGAVDIVEPIKVGVVDEREPRTPVHTINASVLQWADDTSENPEGFRIEIQPYGRLLAGFDNRFVVRVTDEKGNPQQREVTVALLSGELGGEQGPGVAEVDGGRASPPYVFSGHSDALGLATFHGRLDSDVVRLNVALGKRLDDPPADPNPAANPDKPAAAPAPVQAGGPAAPPARPPDPSRRFRLVSFSGGVQLWGEPRTAAPGETVKLEGASLQPKRPIYVDVHGPDGAWIDTLMPPLRPFANPREWVVPPQLGQGMVHFEGYAYTSAPGQSAEVHRVLIREPTAKPLADLIDAQDQRLSLPREKTGFDPEVERVYLGQLAHLATTPELQQSARAWLMGTLPVEVYGPPLAVTTRGREEAALEAWKVRWTTGLRWFLWGGGALAIMFTAGALVRQQRTMIVQTRAVLDDPGDSMMLSAGRDLLTRGIVVIVILSSALVLTAVMLESLVWKF